MVRSSQLQIKVKDQEIGRLRRRLKDPHGNNEIVLFSPSVLKTPKLAKIPVIESALPSLNESNITIGDKSTRNNISGEENLKFKEPSKLDRLNELSEKFKRL